MAMIDRRILDIAKDISENFKKFEMALTKSNSQLCEHNGIGNRGSLGQILSIDRCRVENHLKLSLVYSSILFLNEEFCIWLKMDSLKI